MENLESYIDTETTCRAFVECAGCGVELEDAFCGSEDQARVRLFRQIEKDGWAIAGSKEYAVTGSVCPVCLSGEGEIKDWVKE